MSFTVFIADDEARLRRPHSAAPRDADFEVLSAQSAESGETLLSDREADVDLMILDVKLPGRSGLDLLQSQREKGYAGPVIVMTAFDNSESERRCRQLSVDRFLRKPFDLDAMLDHVRGLLRGSELRSGVAGH